MSVIYHLITQEKGLGFSIHHYLIPTTCVQQHKASSPHFSYLFKPIYNHEAMMQTLWKYAIKCET